MSETWVKEQVGNNNNKKKGKFKNQVKKIGMNKRNKSNRGSEINDTRMHSKARDRNKRTQNR